MQSPGTSTSKGVEIAADVPFGERWELLANWTNNDADRLRRISRALQRPENLGNVGLLYRAADERLSFIANCRLSRDCDRRSSGAPLDDYEVLDLSVSYDASETFEIFGRVQNATDETYQEVVGYNTAERSIYGGVRLRF